MNKSEYQKYLASREWALLKGQVRKRSHGRCERCLCFEYEQTHHLTYERIGEEKLEDLLAVCEPCHEYISGKSNNDPSVVFLYALLKINTKVKRSYSVGNKVFVSAILKAAKPILISYLNQRDLAKAKNVKISQN
jgi:hypothetical protein